MTPDHWCSMLDEAFERAVGSPHPLHELRSFAQDLFNRGQDQTAILATFEEARQYLREANRDKDEDVVLEVMDFLTDWCSPHMRLPADGQKT